VLPSPPPISVFISSPSIPTYDHPYFSLSIIYLFNLLPSFQFFKPLELRHKLHLPTYLTCFFLVFVSLQRLFMLFSSAFHRFFCNFWQGVLFQFFGSRSTFICQLLQDTHLTTGFSGVLGFHRWSPVPPPPPASRRVACTLQSVPCSGRRVATPFDPTASHHFGHRWFRAKSVFPVAERPPLGIACPLRAVTDGSHCSSSYRTAAVTVYVFISLLFFWAYLLYPSPPVYPCFCVWVLATQYTCDITFIGDPGFEASVPRAKGPASSEALPPRTFIFRFKFGLPKPSCFCSFKFSL
jgi:hypothetical protein